MKKFLIFLIFLVCSNCQEQSTKITIIPVEAEKKVDILIGKALFTSYIYSTDIKDLKKTILFPVYSPGGNMITRGFPLVPMPGERVDHPHQVGFWLNYGDVNGIDFWNNSDAIPPERRSEMGTIRHKSINKIEDNLLRVTAEWVDAANTVLLEENTDYIFHADKNYR